MASNFFNRMGLSGGAGADPNNPSRSQRLDGTAPTSTTTYDPNTNYGNSGMSQKAYEAMYGTPDQQGGAAAAAGKAAGAAGDAQAQNPYVNPTLPNSKVPGSPAATAAATPTYGTESGPGILDQWFNERATGTDPAYEYTTGRGLKALDTASAARGGYNSGAALQQDSDFLANSGAQRMGQLDNLAVGASGEQQNNLNSMLGLGMGLAGGGAGVGTAYDTGAASAMGGANNTGLTLGAQGTMLPYMAQNQGFQNLMGVGMMGALL